MELPLHKPQGKHKQNIKTNLQNPFITEKDTWDVKNVSIHLFISDIQSK